MLTRSELTRYSRHFNLPNFGREAQIKLKESKVLVVGAGGLGSPLLLYLTAAGIGHIGIIDPDVVDLSNLQRQVLFNTYQIGQSKSHIAVEQLKLLNPNVHFTEYDEFINTSNAIDIISQYHIVADGSDNFPTRYLVNDACVLCNKTNVYASIFRFEGQVSVFNALLKDDTRSANYRDLYPHPPPPDSIPDCATGGVLGILAGIVGNMQALEVVKVITGIGEPLVNQLLLYDALSSSTIKIKYNKRAHNKIEELINYEHFCGVLQQKSETMSVREVTVQQLKEMKDSQSKYQLIDVRESNEYEFANIGGELIPLGSIMSSEEKIKKDVDVIIMCRSGQRSAAAVNALQKNGYENLFNLKGGILAWSREIDNTVPQY